MATVRAMRFVPVVVVALVAGLLLAAGCGGGSTLSAGSSADDVAGIVPANVPLLVAVETDSESAQWQQADELLDKFPGKQRLLDSLQEELSDEALDIEQDVVPALGDETYLAFLDFEHEGANVVGLTQPRDQAKFDALLEKADEPLQTREVDGWTLVAESEAALDRFTAAGEKLADAAWFADAQARVEDEALVTVFANGAAIHDAVRESLPEGCKVPEAYGRLEYATAFLAAEDDGVRFRLAAAGDGVQDLLQGESLLSRVPAGAFAYLGSPGFDSSLFDAGDLADCDLDSQGLPGAQGIPDVTNFLGIKVEGLADLFSGGFALSAKRGAIIPEVTLLLAPEDEAKAVATLDKLAGSLAAFGTLEVQRRQVGDVDARALALGPVTLLWGAGDGKVVVTTSPAGFDALTGGGDSLEDDDDFRGALDAAGVGEGDEVFVYLDLEELIPLAELLAGLSNQSVPPDVLENLEPLGTLLVWGDLSDPNDVEAGAFLAIR